MTATAGFILGLLGDRIWMRKMHGNHQHAMPCCGSRNSPSRVLEEVHEKGEDYMANGLERQAPQTPAHHDYANDEQGEK